MTYATVKDSFELAEQSDLDTAERRKRRSACRMRICLYVFVTISLIAIMGILMAMFGPGSKDLKYRDSRDCKATANEDKEQIAESREIQCDVVIVGGGLSGLFMAETLLRKKKETSVCVYEKENRFGGRILDYWFDQAPDIAVGLGAWRVDSSATNMMNLIRRLNISTVNWDYQYPSFIESRGIFSNNTETIKQKAFPTLNKGRFKNMTSNEMTSYAFRDDLVSTAWLFPSVDSYMSYYLSPEAAEFLSELFGYKGDYTAFINPAAYIEFLKKLFSELSDVNHRPLNGMSEIVEAIVTSARNYGAKLYAGRPVVSIEKKEEKFIVRTENVTVSAQKVVIATHPAAFRRIGGQISEEIQRDPIFQSIKTQTAFKGAAVYREAWWKDTGNETSNFSLKPRQKFISNSNCLGTTLPYGGRGPSGEAVLGTMYMDGYCSRKWGDILRISKSDVDRELKRALEYKFKRKVPDPLATVYQYWDEGAWHFQKPGFNYTLADVSNWAKRPLPGRDIFVIGDAYSFLRGWTEGAILSANNALFEGWGIPEGWSLRRSIQFEAAWKKRLMDSTKDLASH